MTKSEYYKNVIGVNYDDLLKVGNGYIDGKKPDFTKTVPRTNQPTSQSPSELKPGLGIKADTLVDEKFNQHIEYLHQRSFWRNILPKFIWYTWFWPAAAIVVLTYYSYNEGEGLGSAMDDYGPCPTVVQSDPENPNPIVVIIYRGQHITV